MAGNLIVRRITVSTLAFVSLGVMTAAFLSGCQDEAKTSKTPTTEKTPVVGSNAAASAPTAEPAKTEPSTPKEATPAPVSGPRMTFEETVHDFGKVVPATAQKTEFKFKNTGSAPLKIKDVRPCCGTVVTGIETNQVFAPGRGGTVSVEWPGATQAGAIVKYIYVTTNDPTDEIATLTFKADVVQQVDCEPSSLRLFLHRENGGAGTPTVKSLTGEPFSISAVRSTSDVLTTTFDPAVKATQFVLKLTADVEKLKAHERGRIEVIMNHPGCKGIYVDYDVLPEFTISPPQLMAFNLKSGEAVQKEIWILGNYDNDFEIESVTSQNGTMKVVEKEKVKVAPSPVVSVLNPQPLDRSKGDHFQYRLKVEITPPQDTSTPAVDKLIVTIKGGETLPIEFRGFYYGGN
jgi:hypothetical protein